MISAAAARRHPGRLAGATVLALLVVLALAWDWDWFRGPLVRHLAEQSGREVEVGRLEIAWHAAPDPTVRLLDVHIANAPWVTATAGQAFARAREASFTFGWRSLLRGRPVVTRLRLVGADVALERRADGMRNWRLRRPDDRGTGKFTFMRLEPHDSRLRVVNEHAGLDLHTASTDLPASIDVKDGAPLVQRIAFSGRLRGAPFEGVATASRTLSFLHSGEAFSVRGAARSGALRLEADGQVADLFRLGRVAAALRLSGPSLTALAPWLPQAWPDTPAFTAEAQLAKAGEAWTFTRLDARVGRSDVGGELTYHQRERPDFEARLTSRALHAGDLGLGRDTSAPAGASDRDEKASLQGLQRLDGRATLDVDTLHLPGTPPLRKTHAEARLAQGRLIVTPLRLGIAGGQAEGTLDIDSTQRPPQARLDLRWRDVQLADLLPPLPADRQVNGPVSGRLQLQSHGASVSQWLANTSGQAHAEMRSGSLSAALDARLALNGGKVLRAAVADPSDVPIACARVELALREGRADLFPVQLDTAQTRIDGRGELDLRQRRLDLLLTPQPKQPAVLALKQSIRIRGPWSTLSIDRVPQEAIRPAAGCPAR